jgi:hypothetical protein
MGGAAGHRMMDLIALSLSPSARALVLLGVSTIPLCLTPLLCYGLELHCQEGGEGGLQGAGHHTLKGRKTLDTGCTNQLAPLCLTSCPSANRCPLSTSHLDFGWTNFGPSAVFAGVAWGECGRGRYIALRRPRQLGRQLLLSLAVTQHFALLALL